MKDNLQKETTDPSQQDHINLANHKLKSPISETKGIHSYMMFTCKYIKPILYMYIFSAYEHHLNSKVTNSGEEKKDLQV